MLLFATARECADDIVDGGQGVQLDQLLPFTTLLVQTMNSLYHVVVVEATDVYVEGGEFFHGLQPACLDGSSTAKRCLKAGWIGVGRMMEFRSGGRRIVTSPVLGIVIEPPSSPIVH
jgi:hypothetical protein